MKILKVEDYKCPECGAKSYHEEDKSTLLTKTESICRGDFKHFDYGDGYMWIEIHKCDKCECLYCYQNGC